MIFGMSTFTFVHVVLSLVGIAAGVVVMVGLLTARKFSGWTALFLVTTLATCVTGFGFPFTQILPSHVVGILSLVVLAIAIVARYGFKLQGAWRWLYVVGAMTALYFNVFVLVAQMFAKLPALHALAPTQSEPPFLIAQSGLLLLFLVLGAAAVAKFKSQSRFSN